MGSLMKYIYEKSSFIFFGIVVIIIIRFIVWIYFLLRLVRRLDNVAGDMILVMCVTYSHIHVDQHHHYMRYITVLQIVIIIIFSALFGFSPPWHQAVVRHLVPFSCTECYAAFLYVYMNKQPIIVIFYIAYTYIMYIFKSWIENLYIKFLYRRVVGEISSAVLHSKL